MADALLYVVRHAEQEPSPDESPAAGLSARGEEQAHRLGERLSGVPFAVIHHSPLTRAARTAQLVAGHLPGVAVQAGELLRDRTPVPDPDRPQEYPPRDREWFDTVPPDERDPGGVLITAAFDHFTGLAAASGEPQLLVTHGQGGRRAHRSPARRYCAPGKPPVLVGFNDVGHLG